MVVVARFLWVHQRPGKNDESSEYSVDPVERQVSLRLKGAGLRKLFTPKQERGHWVPTLSSIIKAGDEGIYSSTLFNGIQGHPGVLPLETLHDAFSNELQARPTSERSAYPSEIASFLTTKKGLRRSQSVKANKGDRSKHGRPELSPRPQRASLDLAEMGLNRSRSRKVAPVLVSAFGGLAVESGKGTAHGLWAQNLQHALYFEGRPGVSVNARELATLSVILASPIGLARRQDKEKTERHSTLGRGAHGISISGAATEDGRYHISLTQHRRSISQLPAQGSGYSILFAKHLASGSLPFSRDTKTVDSIMITKETLEALRSGTTVQLQMTTPQTPASTFLADLPHAKTPTFHNLKPTDQTPTPTPPHTLLHAIAALPFTGGLTPLASAPLIATVQFVATGGLVPGRLLQRLEALVDKVHRHSPALQLFGPLYHNSNAGLLFRERDRLGKLATGAIKSAEEPLADKTARMHRYITLVERLMCLVPSMKPHDVLFAVKEEVKKQIEQSYTDAVAAHANSAPMYPIPTHHRQSSLSRHSTQRTRHSAHSQCSSTSPASNAPASPVSRTSLTSPRSSLTFPPNNLGVCIESVLKMSLPLDVPTIALVVRMVIVAWTLSVGTVAWEAGEEGFKVLDLDGEKIPEGMVLW
ncbi:hypothetical protein K458DRAFT_440370 [Lentithecium fluviatile CBS 122367]|uniref:Uncharacterized protein n=1 Tax=Lentithecium fluviatile CBS 122367 TaxID=1168545 RepID=A0A6G1JEB9_9PLEO|nr:hypothetical protein K458DRAFT_440370 [Lentithecium fluviatile CBS 122367]